MQKFVTFVVKESQKSFRNDFYYTDKYRDAAHSICSLTFNLSYEIPVDFHNGPN